MPEFNVDTTVSEVIKALGTNALGKTFVITGPSAGGIGATAAIALASAKAKQLILAGRSQSKAQPVIDEIVKVGGSDTTTIFVELDLTDLSSVRRAAAGIREAAPDGINGLYNNAGIMAPREFKKSADGVELQFAANHLGHFLLTNLLLPDIAKVDGIVVNATSRSWTLADPDYDDVNFQDGNAYHGWIAYSRSKTANIHFSIALSERVKKLNITVFAVDPGMAMDSNLTKNSGIDNDWFGEGFRIATERGNESTGSYLEECEIRDAKLADYAKSLESAEKLWDVSEKLIGEKFAP
ncbi:hypothetical protein DL765_006906 [Monosporascus sp. GIB2]|nr:hypothetical protein DL765_006906 [Monosporascus sp. GIB2]